MFLQFPRKSIDNFVSFVDKTLVLYCNKLKKFGVRFAYASNVSFWTEIAVGKGAEELVLDFNDMLGDDFEEDQYYFLPQRLYINSSFKVLKFDRCGVVPEEVVCWTWLKRLSIGYTILSEDVIQNILVVVLCWRFLSCILFMVSVVCMLVTKV